MDGIRFTDVFISFLWNKTDYKIKLGRRKNRFAKKERISSFQKWGNFFQKKKKEKKEIAN